MYVSEELVELPNNKLIWEFKKCTYIWAAQIPKSKKLNFQAAIQCPLKRTHIIILTMHRFLSALYLKRKDHDINERLRL